MGFSDGHSVQDHNGPLKKKQRKSQNTQGANGENPITFWDLFRREISPSVDKITEIHVYDFDNTLFRSPLPNPALFTYKAIGALSDGTTMLDLGWWQDPVPFDKIAETSADGSRHWNSYWNDDILPLLELSHKNEQVLTIIMTGRKKHLFRGIMSEMLQSKGITADAVVLKEGKFVNTISYKTQVLVDMLERYTNVKLVKIFEDRENQMKGFQKFLNEYIDAVNPEMVYSIIPVYALKCFLSPQDEIEVVTNEITKYNNKVSNMRSKAHSKKYASLALRKSFVFVSYYLSELERAVVLRDIQQELPDVFTKEVMDTYRFELEHIPLTRGMMARKTYMSLSKSHKELQWNLTHVGLGDGIISFKVAPCTDDVIKTLLTPALLPACTSSTSNTVPEDYSAISDWIDIQAKGLKVNTTLTQLVKFNITSDGKKI